MNKIHLALAMALATVQHTGIFSERLGEVCFHGQANRRPCRQCREQIEFPIKG